jgi:hypothetical protein
MTCYSAIIFHNTPPAFGQFKNNSDNYIFFYDDKTKQLKEFNALKINRSITIGDLKKLRSNLTNRLEIPDAGIKLDKLLQIFIPAFSLLDDSSIANFGYDYLENKPFDVRRNLHAPHLATLLTLLARQKMQENSAELPLIMPSDLAAQKLALDHLFSEPHHLENAKYLRALISDMESNLPHAYLNIDVSSTGPLARFLFSQQLPFNRIALNNWAMQTSLPTTLILITDPNLGQSGSELNNDILIGKCKKSLIVLQMQLAEFNYDLLGGLKNPLQLIFTGTDNNTRETLGQEFSALKHLSNILPTIQSLIRRSDISYLPSPSENPRLLNSPLLPPARLERLASLQLPLLPSSLPTINRSASAAALTCEALSRGDKVLPLPTTTANFSEKTFSSPECSPETPLMLDFPSTSPLFSEDYAIQPLYSVPENNDVNNIPTPPQQVARLLPTEQFIKSQIGIKFFSHEVILHSYSSLFADEIATGNVKLSIVK